MTDFRLLLRKHGRILTAILCLMLFLSVVRLISDTLVVQQIYGVGEMLLGVALTFYALLSILSTTALGDDRLLLLSSKSRWQISCANVVVLLGYLLLSYLFASLPHYARETISLSSGILEFASYAVSVFCGLGLMLCIVYVLKALYIGKRSLFVGLAWFLYLAVVSLFSWGLIVLVEHLLPDVSWLLGVGGGETVINVYATILPISILNTQLSESQIFVFLSANLALALMFWILSYLLSRRAINYLNLK